VIARALILLLLLATAGVYARSVGSTDADVAREPLSGLPEQIGVWRGIEADPFPDDVVQKLGVDDYVDRRYFRAEHAPVAVYVGYYGSQRQGDTIHSPQNCLPGAGWRPIDSGRENVRVGDGAVSVNRYVITKGLERQVVLYWYQGRGRVVANEYSNKAFLMLDAARLGRTNGGLVRLITPVVTTTDAATREVVEFARALLPHLSRYLP
jgi:EpsI family protein